MKIIEAVNKLYNKLLKQWDKLSNYDKRVWPKFLIFFLIIKFISVSILLIFDSINTHAFPNELTESMSDCITTFLKHIHVLR